MYNVGSRSDRNVSFIFQIPVDTSDFISFLKLSDSVTIQIIDCNGTDVRKIRNLYAVIQLIGFILTERVVWIRNYINNVKY